jgi:hypothetical protein
VSYDILVLCLPWLRIAEIACISQVLGKSLTYDMIGFAFICDSDISSCYFTLRCTSIKLFLRAQIIALLS